MNSLIVNKIITIFIIIVLVIKAGPIEDYDLQNDYSQNITKDFYVNDRQLLTEYEITHPNYTFNGTWSPAREYEWEKTEVPSVTPSSNPSSNPSSFPTKKKKRTKKPTPKPTKKKVTRRPTPKPSKKPTKRRRPNNYPTDSPNCIGGGCYGNYLCHDGCFQFAGDGVCDDGGPNASYFICMYGSDCTDCGPRQLRTKEPSLSPTKV